MPPTPRMITTPMAEAVHAHVGNVAANNQDQQSRDASRYPSSVADAAGPAPTPRQGQQPVSNREDQTHQDTYVSKIGVLTTSLPMYHNQIMKMKKDDEARRLAERRAVEEGEPLGPRESEMLSSMSTEVGTGHQTNEQQAETIRRLKPHSRSTLQIHTILNTAAQNPEDTVTHVTKKSRSTKWQFGIRSKNEPVDAIRCLYKALATMGDCQWHVNPPKDKSNDVDGRNGGPFPVNIDGATHIPTGDSNLSESPEKERHHALDARQNNGIKAQDVGADEATSSDHTPPDIATLAIDSDSENDSDVDIDNPPPGYFPKDPWCIHVRWEKKGMVPPSMTNSNSARSSRVDLASNDGLARRGSSALGSSSSAAGSTTSVVAGMEPLTTNFNDTACFVYLDLQIYSLEMETYLVDFKCAGYESIVGSREVVNRKGQTITEYIGSGSRVVEKDVTSPQPFLDLTNKLVIHLANGKG
jgi:carbon catabolite-derepressing protein kinase